MILFANLLCVLLTYCIESWVFPGCSYEFNVVYLQWQKRIVFFILQQHRKYTFSKINIKENH